MAARGSGGGVWRSVSLIAAAVLAIAFPAAHAGADEPSARVRIPSCAAPASPDSALPAALPLLQSAAPVPGISARAAAVIDAGTGRVLYDLHAHDRMRPASTTKIMTAILAIEHGGLDRAVVSQVDGSAMVGSSIMGLVPGAPITVRDLLYGLMLPSGNDAAVQLAVSTSGSVEAFVGEMNARAAALGLRDTHFENPHGLDRRGHYSSAFDLSQLGRYAMQNPTFAEIAGARAHHLAPPWDYDLFNGNSMLDVYPGADGVKIGWTERAGWTLVASATRDGHRLIATVLDSTDRDADASTLLDWAFASYRWLPLGESTDRTLRLAQRLGIGAPLVQALAICG